MPKKTEAQEESTPPQNNVDTALWDLYNRASTMKQDAFNRQYKVIEQIVKLNTARISKTDDPNGKVGSFFDEDKGGRQ